MIPRLGTEPADAPYAAFLADLRRLGFTGQLTDAYADRTVLATDNSVYQRTPRAVAYPATVSDLQILAKLAADQAYRSIVIAPRGGGTGTNGQSLSDGMLVDISRNMNCILEINPAGGWARVEAGVVKDQLNAALQPYGLFFAPELSTSNRATIGGMISTDASGQGSCLYGKTRDHVLELTTVLLDGSVWTSRTIDEATLAEIKARPDKVGLIHRTVDDIQREQAQEIARRFPKLNRCLTGYDLAHIRNGTGEFDLNAILCGSEGTLGFLAEAKVRVLPIPKCSAIVNIRYGSFDGALRDASNLIELKAASVETVDSLVLSLGRNDSSWAGVGQYFPDDPEGPAQAINLVEFIADNHDGLEMRLSEVEAALQASSGTGQRRGHTIARSEKDTKEIWTMRKRAAGLLGNVQGEKRPIPFVEDTAVPPEKLADYIVEFRDLLDRRGLAYGMFGHVDAGVLHVRPAIDMKDPEQERLLREITDEVAALTLKYGGLLWGEHGKGLRSEYGPSFFGPLYPALQEIKGAFDPGNQLNPGKIVAPTDGRLFKLDEITTRGQLDRQIAPQSRAVFSEAMYCNGNGACFNFDPDDAMCPSWKATRDRQHSPKGRSGLAREWLRLLDQRGYILSLDQAQTRLSTLPLRIWNSFQSWRGQADFSHEVKAAMDGCLACKSCVGQCPIKVDVPAFRSKFLSAYYGRYLRPPRDLLVAVLERALPIAAHAPTLYNAFVASAVGTRLLQLLGLVATPKLTGQRPEALLSGMGVRLATEEAISKVSTSERERSVVIVQDAFTSYFDTKLLVDLARVIQGLGHLAWIAPFKPNGKPALVNGRLEAFQRLAGANARMLNALSASGVKLVGIDPSMTLTYRSEYRTALGKGAPMVLLPQEWLKEILSQRARPAPAREQFYLLPHCTERTNAIAATGDWKSVFASLGADLNILPSGCCGMAGTYGHEAANRATSELIYSMSWGPVLERSDIRDRLLATGYSCRSQVRL
ncbi:MAG: linked oxidase-like, partial [Microvirga sp.]|nr:linked oxidase-like [Microvirga sp.]